jgi:hypothetical protein
MSDPFTHETFVAWSLCVFELEQNALTTIHIAFVHVHIHI